RLVMPPSALMQLMINLIVQMLRADKVQKHQSALAGKIGQQVGSEVLTIVDDGRVPCAVGSKVFDDEGYPTRRTILIEKGVLKSFLYNTYTAHKDGVKSTGNSHRVLILNPVPKYTLAPFVGPTNIVLKPGTSNKESLIGEVKNGLITKGFIGAHTANIASGDLSVALDCPFKIEDGEKSYPIKEAMISGNIFDLLKNVEAVGNDVKQFEFNLMGAMIKDSSLISPSILVRDVSVST
ncbi:MAG: TldD/PmbA family protein, partial [Candidatus Bathyarchaeota archaeon]|nr:TldD/PmbA family protein [Candidatus Bathyarchaeota archaeon]